MGSIAYKKDEPDYEIINGQIHMMSRPSMNHGDISLNIASIFRRLLKGKTCKVHIEPDVFLDENNNLIPDVVILCDRSKRRNRGIYGAPDLIVEILSPSTAKKDIVEKKDVYGIFGVREYWIVRPELKEITVYHAKDNALEVDNIYYFRTQKEQEDMTDDDKKSIVSSFNVSLFADFEINLAEVFEDIE